LQTLGFLVKQIRFGRLNNKLDRLKEIVKQLSLFVNEPILIDFKIIHLARL
jgi:hypothetical protein